MNMCSAVNPYHALSPQMLAAKPMPQAATETSPVAPEKGMGASFIDWVNTGVNGTNAIGTVITLPNEALKLADGMADAARALSGRQHLLAPLRHTPLAALSSRAMSGTLKVLEQSTTLASTARVVMQAPVIGRLTQPGVADFVSKKVLPTVNALGAGVAIYDHSRRFQKAQSEGNTAGQVLSGVQIGLNAVSAVTGYMKGNAQTVSAVAGLGSLALDIGSWATGIGYVDMHAKSQTL
jgi:hypothetical protein